MIVAFFAAVIPSFPSVTMWWPLLQGGMDEVSSLSLVDKVYLAKLLFLASFVLILNAAMPSIPQPSPPPVAKRLRHRTKCSRRKPDLPSLVPPPPFNALDLLGCAFPWRCCKPQRRKRNPKHYHLILKVLRRQSKTQRVKFNRKTARASEKKRKSRNQKAEKQARSVPQHWNSPSDEEILEDYTRNKHRFLHLSFLQIDAQYGVDLEQFVQSIDPLKQFNLIAALSNPMSSLYTKSEEKTLARSLKSAKSNAVTLTRAINAAISQIDCHIPLISDPLRHQSVYLSDNSKTPMVIDTGASVSITPHESDFISKVRPSKLKSINGLQGSCEVVGSGTVEWTIRDVYGSVRRIRTTAYLVPAAQIRLFSPQCYFQETKGAGSLFLNHRKVVLTLADQSELEFPFQSNNIPMMLDASAHCAGLGFEEANMLCGEDEVLGMLSVGAENNQNLTAGEKEMLLYHAKLGHAHFKWIQRLLAQPNDPSQASILPCRHKGASNSQRTILCAACELGKQARRTPETQHAFDDREMAIREGDLQPGAKVSIDSYVSFVPGRLPHTKAKEKKKNQYSGGTIFCDHASGAIFIVNQVSLRAGETLMAKHKFERWARANNVPEIKSYRADHTPFNSATWQHDIALKKQTIDFSGVGAHHQNAVAERGIQTVTKWARTMLLHQVIHWPDQADLHLWPFAMEHAAYIWNNLPRRDTRLAPLEIFSQSRFPNYNALHRLHVFGCPTYVLDPKLQDGKKIPKWNPRSRRGMYLGYSPHHSSTVARILNLRTKYVSPQYHFVCDDHFSTVPNSDAGGATNPQQLDANHWFNLVESGYENFRDVLDRDAQGRPIAPPLNDERLTPTERAVRLQRQTLINNRRRARLHQQAIQNRHQAPLPGGNNGGQAPPVQPPIPLLPINPPQIPPLQPVQQPQEPQDDPNEVADDPSEAIEAGDNPNADDDLSVPEGVVEDNTAPPEEEPNVPTEVPIPNQGAEDEKEEDDPTINRTLQNLEEQEPSRTGRRRFKPKKYGLRALTQNVRHSTINQAFLASLKFNQFVETLRSDEFAKMWSLTTDYDQDSSTCEWLHPMILAAKANSEDNPNWEAAMNGPLADGYMEAASKEIETLKKMEVWEVVPRLKSMNVLPSTWAFKCKRYPDGKVRKLKGRFCVRGDRQKDGIDYDSNEIFSPVVSWQTVRLLLILSIVLGLETKQVDYTAAFTHAPIGNKEVFCEMPRGFAEEGKVLKLKKSLYGLKQSPVNFFNFIKDKLEKAGFQSQDSVDPCLFISDKVICLVYVDDTLFFSPKEEYITEAINSLKDQNVAVEIEDSVAGFLGVHIERDESNKTIKLTQKGLTKRIIEALNIESEPQKHTPALKEPLGKDENGDPANGSFSYASVIGMALYLCGHSRPDIQFAVSQCARFIHGTKRSHEKALIRIGQYLKSTTDEGLILRPTDSYDIECHVDADFAGLYSVEDVMDPTCVKSRTGYVISVCGCPVVWVSRLQTDIATATMEAEYNALSMAMRDLLPLQRVYKTVAHGLGLSDETATSFKTTVWEDNMGCLKLARLKPGQYTPRSKHYAVKYHWFRSHVSDSNNRISVEHIDSEFQKADILTKGLTLDKFRTIRKLLCGW